MPNSSFYGEGLPYEEGELGVGNVPIEGVDDLGAPRAANSSFYPDGTAYEALNNSDAVLAAMTALEAAANLDAQNSAASAVSSASSAVTSQAQAVIATAQAVIATTQAGNSATSAAAALASQIASAASAAAALVSENNADTSEAAALASAGVATAQAVIATTQAGNSATSATASAGSATASAGSATAASGSATAAATSATNAATSATNAAASVQAAAGTATPLIDGTAAVGTGVKWSREDHKHPADTVTADARISNAAGTATPLINGTAAVGTGVKWSREDHKHPTDTTRADAAATTASLALKADLASPAFSGAPTAPTAALATNTTQIATTAFVLANASGLPPKGHLSGLALSTAGTSSSFAAAAGEATNSTGSSLMVLASSLQKSNIAWTVGVNGGSLDTGTIAASTWYHVYLIKRLDTGVVDLATSLSATTPNITTGNIPTAYTVFRRIGSLKTDVSSNWTKFYQNGDEFLWDVPIADAASLAITTTASAVTLTVPTGVTVNALVQGDYTNTSVVQSICLLYSPAGAAQAAGVPAGNWSLTNSTVSVYCSNPFNIRTNTSAQLNAVAGGASNNLLYIITKGWIDTRGRG